VIPGGAETRR